MQRLILLILACIALSFATEPDAEQESAASGPVLFYSNHQGHDQHDLDEEEHEIHEEYRGRHHADELEDHRHSYGLKNMRGHKYTSKEQKIIDEVFSPDYHEPTIVLDYRYLKSGGRQYIRGPGGQVLILPPNAHNEENKEHRDYDSLIEFLRLRSLAKSRDDHNLRPNHQPHRAQHDNHHKHDIPWY